MRLNEDPMGFSVGTRLMHLWMGNLRRRREDDTHQKGSNEGFEDSGKTV